MYTYICNRIYVTVMTALSYLPTLSAYLRSQRVVSQASAAMEAFLRQAAEFADSSCADSKALAMAKLQTISATAEEVTRIRTYTYIHTYSKNMYI